MRLAFLVIAFLFYAPVASGQGRSYTDEQMRLASVIGSAAGGASVCPALKLSIPALWLELRAVGLTPKDFDDDDTAFRRKIVEQAQTVVISHQIRVRNASRGSDSEAEACRTLIRYYGPAGSIRRGLLTAR